MNVNILMSNQFFRDHCSYSFVYPIIKSINLINDKGIKIKFIFNLNKNSFDCDTLIIDSRLEGDTAKYKLFFSEYIGEYEQNNVFIRYIYSSDNIIWKEKIGNIIEALMDLLQ